jgi:carbonic anhydrase
MNIANASATTKLIQSNKLRLLYSRRPCPDSLLPECAEPDPPNSDFPNNWGGYTDVLHVDFKTPSEHTINGERYDGEMQIFNLHPTRRRLPAVSVLINSTNIYNWQFQAILDQFQAVYDTHKARCATKTRRERKLVSWLHRLLGTNVSSKHDDYESWADFSTAFDDPNYNRTLRELQSRYWHPHHPELVPSIYFYGYEGSLTDPPCSEMVSWFITDTPMAVHRRQVEQLQRLIFTHVSPDCEKTSVHSEGSVARPIQDSFRRPVWQCTSLDFPADEDREIVPTRAPTPMTISPTNVPLTSVPPTTMAPTNVPVTEAPVTLPAPVVISQMDPVATNFPTTLPTFLSS